MNKEEIFSIMLDKEKWEVYAKYKVIENLVIENNDLYIYFNDFYNLLFNDKSYIKVRAFNLICKLSKWDKDNLIDKNIDEILNSIFDEKPTNVRMCLNSLLFLIENKPYLKEKIKEYVTKIDYLKYKDTMSPLIKKDIEKIINI